MEDEQTKYLEEAAAVVKQEAFHMQRALDAANLREALKHASNMIGELKTSLLSPTSYYELYLKVFDQLSYLRSHFIQEANKGDRDIADLYEKVQFAGSVLPRLYLLITVGSVYIMSRKLSASEILKDLLEMVKAVQHPIRGLFLRYYLNQCCNQLLPDVDNEYLSNGGDVSDSVDFLLTNLGEMNRLWVRMQHTGSVRDKSRREKERNDIRVTVGSNIVRLSNLVGVNLHMYQSIVLPRILEIITGCKDVLAQQYTMDCMIQAFPDDYHLATLPQFLEACTQLQAAVDVRGIIINMLDRMSRFAGEDNKAEVGTDVDIFGMFKTYIDKLFTEQAENIETKKLLELGVTFLKFSLKFYPLNTSYVNNILETCSNLVEKTKSKGLDQESLKQIVKLLSFPLETISLAILNMNHYPKLMSHLEFSSRKQVAYKIVQAVVMNHKPLNSIELVSQLFEFIAPLLTDSKESIEFDQFEFEDEMQNVAKLVHLVSSEDADVQFEILNMFKKHFFTGGAKRFKYTLPPLVFGYIKLAYISARGESQTTPDKILKILMEILNKLTEGNAELTMKLYLQCAHAIANFDKRGSYEDIAYEFMSQALILYEEELAESETLFNAILLIAGTLVRLHNFEEENLDTLVTKTAKHAARQLKKPDQCNGVLFCTHLFWNERVQDGRRVLECLKKAVKIADICVSNPKNIVLFVTILNKYLYYYIQDVEGIEPDAISSLVELISEHLNNVEQDAENTVNTSDIRTYTRNTIQHIRLRQAQGKYRGITV